MTNNNSHAEVLLSNIIVLLLLFCLHYIVNAYSPAVSPGCDMVIAIILFVLELNYNDILAALCEQLDILKK